VVFRRESKSDAFQRQLGALRHQLGGSAGDAGNEGSYDDRDRDRERDRDRDGGRAERERPTNQAEAPAANSRDARDAGGFSFGGFGSAATLNPSATGPSTTAQGSTPMTVPPAADAQTSVIANNATWKGDFESTGTLHVHGRVEGSLRAKDNVIIAEEADVDATILADKVIVAGLVKGTIRCGSRFEVLPDGRVSADIHTPTLVIHEGANVDGQIRMGSEAAAEAPAEPVGARRAARGGD
jgi:cytoskeletal protein CcmA (bactofilin family)